MKQKLKCFLIAAILLTICGVSLHASVLKWNASTGDVSGYKIYYGLSQGSYLFSEDVGNVTQYSLDKFSLSEGTTYYFVVRAYNAFGESGDSNVVTYAVPSPGDTTPPLPPEGVSGEIVSENILLTWQSNKESDISGYRVYYGTLSRNYGLPIPVDGTEYSIAGLESDITYYFSVTAVDTSGNESGLSSPEIFKIIPYAVEGPMLKWDAAEGYVIGYEVYYGTSQGDYSKNIDMGNVTHYALDNFSLTEGITYYFVIRAYNNSGESDNSNVVTYVVGELIDTEDPAVVIASPVSVSLYNTSASSVNISGSASDNQAVSEVVWSNSLKGSGAATGTTSWSAAGIALAEGENVITVTVSDETGNTSTDVLTIVYTIPDTEAPVVLITSPTSGTKYDTQSDSISIGGTSSDVTGVTQVSWSSSQGGSGTATGTTSWSAAGITLAEGENVITVTASDEAGNTSTDSFTVVYTIPDTTAPVVTIASPTSGTNHDVETKTLNIGGTSSDAVGVTQVSWTNSRGGSGTATGTSSWSAEGIALGEGENVITVTASDEAGNTSTDSFTVVYTIPDTTAPVVTIASPTSGTNYDVETKTLNIGGTSSDAVGVTQVSWTNSRGGSGTATGTSSWSAAGITLGEGENVITVAASDEAGNTSTDSFTVVYIIPDTVSPVVSIISPTTSASYKTESDSMNIGGTASDAVGVTQVNWTNSRGGSGTATGTSSWSAAGISLGEGENVITVAASDEAGNTSKDSFTVVYIIPDTVSPVVSIISPTTSASYKTESDSMNIGGTASDAVGVTQVSWANSRGGSGIATGTSSWSAAGISLGEGENVITVTASDEAGNTSKDSFTVVYTIPDTVSPVVSITSPTTSASYKTESDSMNIGGTASDAVGVTQVSWANSRGGSGITTGTSSWSAAGITLGEGENVITVAASDEAGNTATYTLTVVYSKPPVISDMEAPVLTITEPGSNKKFIFTRASTMKLAGTASDNIGVKEIRWVIAGNRNGVAIGTTDWKVDIPLTKWWNNITITAEDEAGNKTVYDLRIFSWRR